jgi:phage terminase large subunit
VKDCVQEMKTPNIMYCGGFGSGKSRLAGELAWQLGRAYRGAEIGLFRKTRTSIYDTTYKTFMSEVLPPEYIRFGEWKKGTLEVTLRNGSYYHFFGIDNFERKGSLRFDTIIVDEAIELEEDDVVMLQGRLRGKQIPLPQIIYLCNPGPPGGFFWKIFPANAEKPEGLRDLDFAYFSTNSFENYHNPKAYFDRLEKWKGTQYYDRYVLGLWTAMRGLIWSSFDPRIHVIPPFIIPRNWPKKGVVDFGFDNPLAFLWIATDPGTGIKYVYRQYYRTAVLCKRACEACKKVTERTGEIIEAIRADHDAENRAQWEEYWMRTEAAEKAVMTGLQHVEERLLQRPDGKRGIYVFDDSWADKDGFWYGNMDPDPVLREENRPTCLQEEMPIYKWGKNDQPVKQNDHACDALRYDEATDRRVQGKGEDIEVLRGPTYSRR